MQNGNIISVCASRMERRLSKVAPSGGLSGSALHHCWILEKTMALQGNNQNQTELCNVSILVEQAISH